MKQNKNGHKDNNKLWRAFLIINILYCVKNKYVKLCEIVWKLYLVIAINKGHICNKINFRISNSENPKWFLYHFCALIKSLKLWYFLVKLTNVAHTKISVQNHYMANREIFYLEGSNSSYPFLLGVGQDPKAEKSWAIRYGKPNFLLDLNHFHQYELTLRMDL